jgi:hypothetical protein
LEWRIRKNGKISYFIPLKFRYRLVLGVRLGEKDERKRALTIFCLIAFLLPTHLWIALFGKALYLLVR